MKGEGIAVTVFTDLELSDSLNNVTHGMNAFLSLSFVLFIAMAQTMLLLFQSCAKYIK